VVGNLSDILVRIQRYYLQFFPFIYYMLINLEMKINCLSLLIKISQPADGYSIFWFIFL